jgi:hypothetical protein
MATPIMDQPAALQFLDRRLPAGQAVELLVQADISTRERVDFHCSSGPRTAVVSAEARI